MSRPLALLWLTAGCVTEPTAPEPEPEPLEVTVMATCSDLRCEERLIEAVTLQGEPTSWSWELPDGTSARGRTVTTRKVDDLDAYEVLATDDAGTTHRARSAVVSFDMRLAADEDYEHLEDAEISIVIVPMGVQCDHIPVVNIGGCLVVGASPLGLHIDSVDVDTVTFDTQNATYASSQDPQLATWRLGGTEGIAPLSSMSDYSGLLVPPAPHNHFTAYYAGVIDGTSTVLTTHGPPTSAVYSAQELEVTCDKQGKLTSLRRRSVDRKSLDFDGDGYPEGEDCDEFDPNVHEDC